MLRVFASFAFLLWSAVTFAANADTTVTWLPPYSFFNGDPLDPVVDLDHYDIHIGDSSGNYNIAVIEVAPDGTSANVNVTIPGTFQDGDTISLYVAMTATARNDPASNPAWDGSESDFSNEVFRQFVVSIETSPPSPPGSVTASFTITCTAQAGVTCTIQ